VNRTCHRCGAVGRFCYLGVWLCDVCIHRYDADRRRILATLFRNRVHAAPILRSVAA
jgi:transposase